MKSKEKGEKPAGEESTEKTPQSGPDPQFPSEGAGPKAEPVGPAGVPVEGKVVKVEGAQLKKKDGENDEKEGSGEEGGGLDGKWIVAGIVAIVLASVVLWYYLRHNAPDGPGGNAD